MAPNRPPLMNPSQRSTALIVAAGALLTLVPLRLIWRYPFDMPFVDDWILTPWAAGEAPYTASALLQKISGHQSILLKLFSAALGAVVHWNLLWVSVIATLTFGLAYTLAGLAIDR